MTEPGLPPELQEYQKKIDNYRKDEALKKQIGKFYSHHTCLGL